MYYSRADARRRSRGSTKPSLTPTNASTTSISGSISIPTLKSLMSDQQASLEDLGVTHRAEFLRRNKRKGRNFEHELSAAGSTGNDEVRGELHTPRSLTSGFPDATRSPSYNPVTESAETDKEVAASGRGLFIGPTAPGSFVSTVIHWCCVEPAQPGRWQFGSWSGKMTVLAIEDLGAMDATVNAAVDGAPRVAEMLSDHIRHILRMVGRWGGYLLRMDPNGSLLFAFPAQQPPESYHDDGEEREPLPYATDAGSATAAVLCACDLMHSADSEDPEVEPLELRAGVSIGEVTCEVYRSPSSELDAGEYFFVCGGEAVQAALSAMGMSQDREVAATTAAAKLVPQDIGVTFEPPFEESDDRKHKMALMSNPQQPPVLPREWRLFGRNDNVDEGFVPTELRMSIAAGRRVDTLADLRNRCVATVVSTGPVVGAWRQMWFSDVAAPLIKRGATVTDFIETEEGGLQLVAVMDGNTATDGMIAAARAIAGRRCGTVIGIASGAAVVAVLGTELDQRLVVTGRPIERSAELACLAKVTGGVAAFIDAATRGDLQNKAMVHRYRHAAAAWSSTQTVFTIDALGGSEAAAGFHTIVDPSGSSERLHSEVREQLVANLKGSPSSLTAAVIAAGIPGVGKCTALAAAARLASPKCALIHHDGATGSLASSIAAFLALHPNEVVAKAARGLQHRISAGDALRVIREAVDVAVAVIDAGINIACVVRGTQRLNDADLSLIELVAAALVHHEGTLADSAYQSGSWNWLLSYSPCIGMVTVEQIQRRLKCVAPAVVTVTAPSVDAMHDVIEAESRVLEFRHPQEDAFCVSAFAQLSGGSLTAYRSLHSFAERHIAAANDAYRSGHVDVSYTHRRSDVDGWVVHSHAFVKSMWKQPRSVMMHASESAALGCIINGSAAQETVLAVTALLTRDCVHNTVACPMNVIADVSHLFLSNDIDVPAIVASLQKHRILDLIPDPFTQDQQRSGGCVKFVDVMVREAVSARATTEQGFATSYLGGRWWYEQVRHHHNCEDLLVEFRTVLNLAHLLRRARCMTLSLEALRKATHLAGHPQNADRDKACGEALPWRTDFTLAAAVNAYPDAWDPNQLGSAGLAAVTALHQRYPWAPTLRMERPVRSNRWDALANVPVPPTLGPMAAALRQTRRCVFLHNAAINLDASGDKSIAIERRNSAVVPDVATYVNHWHAVMAALRDLASDGSQISGMTPEAESELLGVILTPAPATTDSENAAQALFEYISTTVAPRLARIEALAAGGVLFPPSPPEGKTDGGTRRALRRALNALPAGGLDEQQEHTAMAAVRDALVGLSTVGWTLDQPDQTPAALRDQWLDGRLRAHQLRAFLWICFVAS